MTAPGLAERIQAYQCAYYRRLPFESVSLPPFLLLLTLPENRFGQSFAMLEQPLADDVEPALERLNAEARRRGLRRVRILFLDALAPGLAHVLARAGYHRTQKRVLACLPAALRPPKPLAGLELARHSADSPAEVLVEALRINRRGFDMLDQTITSEDIEVYRRELAGGGGLIATLDGIPVATGLVSPLIDGLTKVAGITTLKAYRRRGIASQLSAALTGMAFAAGADTVYLVARDEAAGRVYERLGYVFCTDWLFYSP